MFWIPWKLLLINRTTWQKTGGRVGFLNAPWGSGSGSAVNVAFVNYARVCHVARWHWGHLKIVRGLLENRTQDRGHPPAIPCAPCLQSPPCQLSHPMSLKSNPHHSHTSAEKLASSALYGAVFKNKGNPWWLSCVWSFVSVLTRTTNLRSINLCPCT